MKKNSCIFISFIMLLSIIILPGCSSKEDSKEASETDTNTNNINTDEKQDTEESIVDTVDNEMAFEGEYTIPEIPKFQEDQNVEEGIIIDSTLATAIRNELGYAADRKLTYEDLKTVTYLAEWNNPVTSLKGISLLENLQEIHIGSGYISDISELALLKKLRSVDIVHCLITEIPDFSGLTELSQLYLGGNLITDLQPLTKAKGLEFVDLSSNLINNLEPIKDLKNLSYIGLMNNCILDFASIAQNSSLIEAVEQGLQCSYEECLEVENTAKKLADEITNGLTTELEKEIAIYQYIIDNMEYVEQQHPSYAYGYMGLINKIGVCGDYAEAFCLLARNAGLEAYTCSSEDHEWNIVKIDGKYYHCDALWDEGNQYWSYFNRSTGDIINQPNHMHNLLYYPICEESMIILDCCE